jgi:hypothetical protein
VTRTKLLLTAFALTIAVIAAPAAAQAQTPQPAEPIGAFAKRLERALTKKRCPGLKAINAVGQIALPCPSSSARYRKAFKNFKIRGSRAYGTGGIIDFTDGEAPKGANYVVTLGEGNRWSIVAAPYTRMRLSRETSPGDTAGHEEVLSRFLPAVRDGDCEGYFATAATTGTKEEECRQALGPDGSYIGLQADLRAHPESAPELLGGTSVFVFYALRTGSTYRTVVTARPPRRRASPTSS